MTLPPYTANADDSATPTDFVHGGYAAREIRATKTKLSTAYALAQSASANASSAITKANNNSSCIGVSNTTDLGTFTGTTIPNSQSVKSALQALETALEALGGGSDAANAYTTLGTLSTATHLGTFTGTTIADNNSVKQALQSLETSLEAAIISGGGAIDTTARTRTDNLASQTGVTHSNTNMGAFTGTNLTDNSNIKSLLQELSNAIDNVVAGTTPVTGAIGGNVVNIFTGRIVWFGSPTNDYVVQSGHPWPIGWSCTRDDKGRVLITHNLGHQKYMVNTNMVGDEVSGNSALRNACAPHNLANNTFRIHMRMVSDTDAPMDHSFGFTVFEST